MYKCCGKRLSRPALAFQTHSSSERKSRGKKKPNQHQNTKKPQKAKKQLKKESVTDMSVVTSDR